MPPAKKEPPRMLEPLKRCTTCGVKLIAMPPCPKCGCEMIAYLSPVHYEDIIQFLLKNKGSQARLVLGKNQHKESILMYELLKKTQLGE